MSSGCLSNVCPSPAYKMFINEEQSSIQKQSIISFNSLSSSSSSSSSIRRTFSAEMLAPNQNGFLSLKRAQSSEHLNFLGTQDHDHHHPNQINNINEEKKGAFEDIWSSIQKNVGSGSGSGTGDHLPPPYVHPLVKRSTSLLSQKSLEVCTESLGSETGSETGLDHRVEKQQEQVQPDVVVVVTDDHQNDDMEVVAARCTKLPSSRRSISVPAMLVPTATTTNNSTSSTPPPARSSSFPPPLPSLSHREGSNLHMRAHRIDGRLVVEAVAVPSVHRLRALRHDGRLLLTLTPNDAVLDYDNNQDDDITMLQEEQQEEEEIDEEKYDLEEEEEEELAIVMEGKTTSYSSTLMMSKLMEVSSCRWPRNLNATIVKRLEDEDEDEEALLNIHNAYSYYWKKLNNVDDVPLAGPQQNNKVGPQVGEKEDDAFSKEGEQLLLAHNKGKLGGGGKGGEREVVVLKAARGGGGGKGNGERMETEEEYLIPLSTTTTTLMRGCKEREREPTMRMMMRMRMMRSSSYRRMSSLLFWDSDNHHPSFCIATS